MGRLLSRGIGLRLTQLKYSRGRVLAGIALLTVVALVTWSFAIEPNSLTMNEIAIPISAIDSQFGPLKVALLSDLHVGSPWIDIKKLREIVARTNNAHPDLILLAGDFVIQDVIGGRFVDPESIASELKNLSAPLG